jgi:hypothetical protein
MPGLSACRSTSTAASRPWIYPQLRPVGKRFDRGATMKSLRAVAAVMVLLASTSPARADVIAPNANTTVEGNTLTLAAFQTASTFQWVFAASELSSVPTGSLVTGIGFRLRV